ncbi:hypothetical protein SCOR_07720 [Sulfidibacter corallicola]|uniref:Uncharacterized protein n=1 Tax=Sulfidibacter corallicola TaxID=2818388 RepID=A0A8A4TMY3_SULCO|nr:hypothetical protein [Sulfidibacter corallicola]QTD51349.1 hypothetical protein J3U87_02675 [Sulfidibacter corallicola]
MDLLYDQALQALEASVRTLTGFPQTGDAADASLHLLPLDYGPSGIGGFVGLQADPPGEITARRLRCRLVFSITTADRDTFFSRCASLRRALLGIGRGDRVVHGVRHIACDDSVLSMPSTAQSGLQQGQLHFKIDYEFTKHPEAADAAIDRIPVNLHVETGQAPHASESFEVPPPP